MIVGGIFFVAMLGACHGSHILPSEYSVPKKESKIPNIRILNGGHLLLEIVDILVHRNILQVLDISANSTSAFCKTFLPELSKPNML